jgi:DNA polymerase-1
LTGPRARVIDGFVIVLVDTFSVVFRAHYALPPMSTARGVPTAALYGFSVMLLKLLRENPGAAFAFAVDSPEATFRDEIYDEYKAGRARTPDPLSEQLERLPGLLAALAVPVHRVPGFEADDVLATLARHARAGAEAALVVSGDRDLLQLAQAPVRVHFIGKRGQKAVTYGEPEVRERFGVAPERLPTWVALIGDASDNLPGVPGIGPATARALLTQHADAASLLANLGRVTASRTRALLEAHQTQILQVEALARLRDDVPLADGAALWAAPSSQSFAELRAHFEELEFKSLLPRLDRLSARGAGDARP